MVQLSGWICRKIGAILSTGDKTVDGGLPQLLHFAIFMGLKYLQTTIMKHQFSSKRKDKKKEHVSSRKEETAKSEKAPAFNPTASKEEDMSVNKAHVKGENTNKEDEVVATLKLHSDTETVDRSKLSLGELMQARVGHSWVSLDYHDKSKIPDDMNPITKALLENDLASFGFWPLINRTGAAQFTERGQQFVDAGLTPQAGESDNPEHRGFSLNPFKNVPGRVEEPDLAHSPKGTIEYQLTQKEVNQMLGYVESKRNADYNLYRFNCTTFAVGAAKAAGKPAPGGSFMGIALPNALYADMVKLDKKGKADVTFAPMLEGEKQGDSKKGVGF